MPRRTLPEPTESELEILKALWVVGPATVRQVNDELGGRTGYTTVLKLLQIMTGKGLVRRDERERAHVYAPTLTKAETQRRVLGRLAGKLFDGSVGRLVIGALEGRGTSEEDLAEIRRIIDRLEKGETG
ncbi:MAG: BlaI/MecI/CopY family transcriptional regulator [Verrucomicrobiae bacterium]|nr:BlaI/MecI/CopY family transcriptional regulator [Verrucomicrobiae bacterium]